jgi:putative ABC transport system permease protein
MNLLKFAFKNLVRRKTRSAITVASIAIAIAVLFTVMSFNRGYESSLRNQIQKMGIHIMVIPIGCPYEAASLILKGGEIPNYLPQSVLDEVRKIDEIEIAAPILIHGIVKPDEGRTDIYAGIDSSMFRLKNWLRIDGQYFRKSDDVILGSDASLIELTKTGDQLYLPEHDRTFDVSGVLNPTGTEDDGFFYLPIATAQQVFNLPGKITGISIRLKDPAAAARVARKLESIPQAEVITMSELLGTMLSLVGSVKTLILSIVIIIIAISTFSVFNTILMSVFERVREIGIMIATGANRAHVFALIWLESVILSLAGGFAGLVLAIVASRAIEVMVKKFLPLAPRESVISLQPEIFLYTLLFMLVVGVGAGFYPAFLAARHKPTEALRGE